MHVIRSNASALRLAIGLALALGILASGLTGTYAAPPMSVELTQTTVAAYHDALVSNAGLADYLADDVVLTMAGSGQIVVGRDAVTALFDDLYHGGFAGRSDVRSLLVASGQVAVEADFVGTHIGEFAGMPATGKTVSVPYTAFYELADGQITALRLYLPVDTILRQLAAPSAPDWSTGPTAPGQDY